MIKSFSQITFDFAHAPEPPQSDSEAISDMIAETETESQAEPETDASTLVSADIREAEPMEQPSPAIKSTRGRKSQKTFAAEADLVNIPADEQLFQRQYYSIGEVSAMFRVNASLLRFWESEFDVIQPMKNRKGDRHFRPLDIKNLQLIYDLLRRRKLTIEGAKDFLKNNKKSKERFEMIQSLQKIRSFLLEVKASL
ncbi:MAG: MerR family transcriptional regulator [Flavitalea sp.]